ncbi:MAG: N-acetylglucosamine kinase [Flavobacteriaceae bacterium]|nr:N-acetylglucosamine kinase [Flavobacteriaceae bacterium]
MILIADGGSTKADWIAIDATTKEELFRVRTMGLNPEMSSSDVLRDRVLHTFQLVQHKDKVSKVYFYGAGCGTSEGIKILKSVFESIFTNADVHVDEDMLAAVYAASGKNPAIVCIIGTGSNSCYFDGKTIHQNVVSLGYILMDEASGNYFGKRLIRDYYYQKMPRHIAQKFESTYNVDADFIKKNLYREPDPNAYLATFAKFMLENKEEPYVQALMKKGFEKFFQYRILPYQKGAETPIYFIGSIAHYFRDILEKVAQSYNLRITDVIQRPIDNLIEFHKTNEV